MRMIAVPPNTAKAGIQSKVFAKLIVCGFSTFRPLQSTSIPHFGQIHPPSSHCLLVFVCGRINRGRGVPQAGQSLRGNMIMRKKKTNGTMPTRIENHGLSIIYPHRVSVTQIISDFPRTTNSHQRMRAISTARWRITKCLVESLRGRLTFRIVCPCRCSSSPLKKGLKRDYFVFQAAVA